MRKICVLALIITILISCSGNKTNFKVEIRVKDAGSKMVYLAQRSLTGTSLVDSAMPDKNGRYMLEGYTQKPDFYILYNHPGNYINLIIHPGDDFRVLTDASSFDENYLVEGSKDSRLIQKMVNMQRRTLEKITEISERYENSRNLPDFDRIRTEIDSTYDRVIEEHRDFSVGLITENPNSLAGLMALYQQLGKNAPVFDYKNDFRYYAMVDSNLIRLYPNSEAVIDLNRKVTGLRQLLMLEAGSPAPDIALPDSTGKVISLSSLRGKKIIIVFWASWSSQSVETLKRINTLYTGPLAGETELYQVSLDRTRESWLRTLKDRNTRGLHVSDLLYWDSPVVEKYHIEKLPVLYLLDEKGIITHKDFSAEELPGLIVPDNSR